MDLKRLKINAIHLPNVQLSTYHYGYLVHDEFLYLERLNEIIDWTRSSGLYNLWYQQTEEQHEKLLVNLSVQITTQQTLTTLNFRCFRCDFGNYVETLRIFVQEEEHCTWRKFD